MANDQSWSVDGPRQAPNISLLATFNESASVGSIVDIDFTLDQCQAIFAAMNVEPAPVDAIWASALAPDQSDAELTQDGSQSNPYSLRRAFYSAGIGKTVLLKNDGPYAESYILQTDSQYSETNYILQTVVPWNMGVPASEAERIVIRGEPGTCPTIDSSTPDVFIDVAMPYLEIAFMRVNNASAAINLGSSNDWGGPCKGTHIHHVCGEFFRQTGGGSNVGFIAVNGTSDTDGVGPVLENCMIRGNNSSANMNNSCLYITQVNSITVRNMILSGMQYHCLYFKHGNPYPDVGGLANVDITLENCFIDGSVTWAASGAVITNNIVTGEFKVEAAGGGWPEPPYTAVDSEGSQDSNEFTRNTILTALVLSVKDFNCDNNAINNNLVGALKYQTGQASGETPDPSTNTNTSDYNVIFGPDDGTKFLFGSEYDDPNLFSTLPEWRTLMGLDLNSLVATGQLVNEATPTTLADYALGAGVAAQTASDIGGPVGADSSVMGIQ